MDSFETECRRLIDGLVRELVALTNELARGELVRARAAQREAKPAAPRVSARLQRALERAEERRRLAAERRAAMALRPAASRRAVAAANPSARQSLKPAPVAHLPPPLFVHKRSRDGSIQKLERPAGESAPPLA